ncbi:MAG: putative transport system permease protein [Pseudonocardiales bacterium]|jgi:putative ABC transport system permease protein|nr:putative transport system permease protein [Pseudonocardiales bacterium]
MTADTTTARTPTGHRRRNARGGAAATLPWRRAPILLFRQPVVFLAIVGAAAILAVAAASGPLFLSTIGTASLNAQAAQTCPESSLPGMATNVSGAQAASTERLGRQTMQRNALPNPYSVAVGETHVQNSLIHLYGRPGALDHVTKLTKSAGSGAWVPNVFAAKLGVRPGGTITTVGGKPIRVAGIYRDLAPDPYTLSHLPSYWCSWTNIIVSTVATDAQIAKTPQDRRQGPLFIVDQPTVARVAETGVRLSWHSPMSTTASPLGAFDDASGRAVTAAAQMPSPTSSDSHLSDNTQIAHTAQRGLTGSIVPIEIAGVIIAGLLVGGAGMFWANARRREIRLLVARGVGPVPLAGKAILETIVPAVVGAALGFVGTLLLVRAVGPATVLESGAPLRALGLVAGTLAIGLLLIGTLGGLSGRERTAGRQASWLLAVPWELVLIGAAIVIALARLDTSAVTVDHTVVRISPLVVLYPLLGATGALLLLGRLIGTLLPGVGRAARRVPNTAYLALRRISRSRAVVVGLIVGTALPCCLLMYGSTVSDTVSREVTQKYQTNLGAPHVLQIYGVHGALIPTKGHGTQVVLYEQDTLFGDQPGYVLGVDPKTFAEYAFVNDAQRRAVDKLTPATSNSSVPAIVVNNRAGNTTNLKISETSLKLEPVAQMPVFPGLRVGAFSMIVVNQKSLSHIDNGTERGNQLWTNDAGYGAARRLVEARGYSVLFELTSKIVVGTTGLLPVTWVFGYLRALAILIGIVALAGLVFGLAARTRSRRVSYVLSRRMGMARLTHVNSLLIELGLVIGLGWVAGSSLGLGSFGFIYRRLDVYPELPPPPSFAVPSTPLMATAVIAAVVVVLASIASHALAERTRPAEILRLE